MNAEDFDFMFLLGAGFFLGSVFAVWITLLVVRSE